MAKTNCWESKKCGREPGGSKTTELGICSAATEKKLDGINHGSKGGRSCWAIAGTLCGGKTQGSYAAKLASCMSCEFYKNVQAEEKGDIVRSQEILKLLGH